MFVQCQQWLEWCESDVQHNTGRSNWGCKERGRGLAQKGSVSLWYLPLRCAGAWKAAEEWRRIPTIWKTSKGSARTSERTIQILGSETDLGDSVVVGEQQSQKGTEAEKILHLEGIEVRIMRGLVLGEHKINDISWRAYEQDFESCVVEGVGKGPKQVFGQSTRLEQIVCMLAARLTKISRDKNH